MENLQKTNKTTFTNGLKDGEVARKDGSYSTQRRLFGFGDLSAGRSNAEPEQHLLAKCPHTAQPGSLSHHPAPVLPASPSSTRWVFPLVLAIAPALGQSPGAQVWQGAEVVTDQLWEQ